MKVEATGVTRAGRVEKRKQVRKSGDPRFTLTDSVSGTSPAEPLSGIASLSAAGPMDMVLMAQSDDSPEERRRRNLLEAESLLDGLDEIRHGLLTGSLSVTTLDRLASTLKLRQSQTDDPQLSETLAELELRVAVELAKLGR